MTAVALSRIHFPITTLGPGKRVGVWFQGCSIKCPGCISVDTWAVGKGKTTIASLVERIKSMGPADGLTISGGEPFDQPQALVALLQAWRELSDADVLIFTGFQFDKIRPTLATVKGLVDAVITGPYDREASQTLALRGSDNQELHILTERGQKFMSYARNLTAADRALDVMFDEEGQVWFAGIPLKDDFLRLQKLLSSEGHTMHMPGIG